MSYVAAAIVGGSAVVGGVVSYLGSQNAANAQTSASDAAIANQNSEFVTAENQQQPWIQSGKGALDEINNNMANWNTPYSMSQFQEDPGYQFDLKQGQEAIQNSAAASGHLVSSQELGNASNYSESMASNEFNNAYNRYQNQISNSYNRLASLAQLGQTSATNTMNAGVTTATNTSNAMMGIGNAQAAGMVGQANAISGGLTNGANGFMNYNLMSQLMPGNGPNATALSNQFNSPSTAQLTMPNMGASAGYDGGGGSYSLLD